MCGRPLRCKGKMEGHAAGLGAVMCAACECGTAGRGPDEIRRSTFLIIATSSWLDDSSGMCRSPVRPVVLITPLPLHWL